MPLKPKRTYRKKKNYKKNAKKKMALSRLPIGGFPASQLVKLRYVAEVDLDVDSVSGYARHVFSANGCYDPDITGTGHQPSNFDRWIDQYKNYTVLGSKFKAIVVPTTLNSVVPGLVGCMLSTTGTQIQNSAGLVDILEQPNNRRAHQLTAGRDIANPFATVTNYFSTKKFFGKGKGNVVADDDLQGTVSTNPQQQGYYELYMYSLDLNNPGKCTFIVTIDYTVMFHERLPTQNS